VALEPASTARAATARRSAARRRDTVLLPNQRARWTDLLADTQPLPVVKWSPANPPAATASTSLVRGYVRGGAVDAEDIARIEADHGPSVTWQSSQIGYECKCVGPWPCRVMQLADDARKARAAIKRVYQDRGVNEFWVSSE
jgi:hypothetical protein